MKLRSNQSNRVGAVVSLAAPAFAVLPVSHAGSFTRVASINRQRSKSKFLSGMKTPNAIASLGALAASRLPALFRRVGSAVPPRVLLLGILWLVRGEVTAGQVLWYDLCQKDLPFTVNHITNTTITLCNAGYLNLSGCAVYSEYWLTPDANAFGFAFDVEPGYALVLQSLQFQGQTYGPGPNEYNITFSTATTPYTTNSVITFPYTTISGGWKPMPGQGMGVFTNIVADNGGIPIAGLTGRVFMLIQGRGATHSGAYADSWSIEGMAVNGSITPLTTGPAIGSFAVKNNTILLSLSNLLAGATTAVERSLSLQTNGWVQVGFVIPSGTATNWSESMDSNWARVFYRLRQP
jgi:hypothetical protein